MRRLDVKVQYPMTAAKASGGTRAGDLPWWQIGTAAAAVILFAVTVWDGDDEQRASPSRPPSR